MFISKKRWQALVFRVNELEKNQNKQNVISAEELSKVIEKSSKCYVFDCSKKEDREELKNQFDKEEK